MEVITSLITSGELVALDNMTDSIFREIQNKQRDLIILFLKAKAIVKLRNIWRRDPDGFLSEADR